MDRVSLHKSAFAMPSVSPAFPPGPYRFVNREYCIIRYRTDPGALGRILPEPLELIEPVVNYEFIRMPDSTGFGDYTESGQVIPVRFEGQAGSYTHQMFVNDHPPIASGREIWGFPKKLAQPSLTVENRYPGRNSELRDDPDRDSHDGVQAPRPRHGGRV
jgi:acetoacetate decarboxylase